jgi:sigma-B regulation protein RsbU (phosphoserine phosphatase)
MGWFTLLLALLSLIGIVLPPSSGARLGSNFVTLLFVVPAAYYLWRLFALVRGRFLWKIRSRLILAHILIAGIPIALFAVILYVSGLLFYYQLSYYLIRNQIGIHVARIHAFNYSLSADLQQSLSSTGAGPVVTKVVLDRDSRFLLNSYPAASIVLQVRDSATNRTLVYGVGNVRLDSDSYQLPHWVIDRDFSGMVFEDVQQELYTPSGKAGLRQGNLYLRSLISGEFRSDISYSLEVSVPFDGEILGRLKEALGPDMLLADKVQNTGLNVMLQDTAILRENVLSATFSLDSAQPSVSRPVWSMQLYPTSWSTGDELGPSDTDVLFVELSTSRLMQNVFSSESNVSRTIIGVLQIVVGFFLAMELLSLIGGVLLTKSITNAVHNLDRGTDFIRKGDFNHRIVVKSDDQLGALAQSFNQMTEYVQSLVKERVQKERLERELEIAKEVQEQLFPKQAPQMKNLELTGLCLPARVVSGDYYDFLQFDDRRMGMALGDICGKGISAALLMANLQATLRSNVLALGTAASAQGRDGQGGVAEVVTILNRQIYNFTSANKFASFFYAVYDDALSSLTFCNAGHNPPLYFGADGYRRLSAGGTVVGIFPDAEFEEETIQLNRGDIVLAYTDGISESVNEYGEEFGEKRLIDLVNTHRDCTAARLQKIIFEEVLSWAFEEERDDDMTMIVACMR